MSDPIPAGSDVPAGTFSCAQCGFELMIVAPTHMPPCPNCANDEWTTVTAPDVADDPLVDP